MNTRGLACHLRECTKPGVHRPVRSVWGCPMYTRMYILFVYVEEGVVSVYMHIRGLHHLYVHILELIRIENMHFTRVQKHEVIVCVENTRFTPVR